MLERVYRSLGLAMTPEYAGILGGEERRAREHVTTHTYDLAEFGLRADVIHRELASLFVRFHWQEPAARDSAARKT